MKLTKLFTGIFLFLLFININAQDVAKVSHPVWSKNANIYEVNVRQYTPEGTFSAFGKHLPELKKLGVDILWLMPINPIGVLNRKGSLGSYYAVKDYKAVNPEFGTLNDLKILVRNIHKQGMKVIIDWVANHTSWDNVWVKDHPDFFTKDAKGNFVPPVADWGDVIDLNYDNKELRASMIDAMEYWVKECDIDGFRCDVAAMVPTDFWIESYSRLSKIKKLFMLAEASENYIHQAFDMSYNWQMKDLMNDIAKGKKKAADLVTFFNTEAKEYKRNDYRMNFTTNHDENSWNGTECERLGDGVKAFTVLCGTVPGMPLIYSGQEAGMNKRLRFFDKDTIEWKASPLRSIFTKLNLLKKKNEALWNGEAGGELKSVSTNNENVFAFTREKKANKVFTVFNFSNQPQLIKFNSDQINGNYLELFSNKKMKISNNQFEVSLQPWEYLVYTK
jgi:cyclomaltodextrinase / maltogenic alpha-amylase / neopullulanase